MRSLAGSVMLHILRVWWCWLEFHISLCVCVFDCLLAVDAILRTDWSHNHPLVGTPPNALSGFNNMTIHPLHFLNGLHTFCLRACVLCSVCVCVCVCVCVFYMCTRHVFYGSQCFSCKTHPALPLIGLLSVGFPQRNPLRMLKALMTFWSWYSVLNTSITFFPRSWSSTNRHLFLTAKKSDSGGSWSLLDNRRRGVWWGPCPWPRACSQLSCCDHTPLGPSQMRQLLASLLFLNCMLSVCLVVKMGSGGCVTPGGAAGGPCRRLNMLMCLPGKLQLINERISAAKNQRLMQCSLYAWLKLLMCIYTNTTNDNY